MLGISNIGAKQATTYYAKDGYYARNESDDRWQGSLREELGLPENITKADFDNLTAEKKRAGYDLCFSAPKSVSIAMTLTDEARADMLASHNTAVQATLAKIEAREIGTRVRDGIKQNHVKTGKMLAGCFTHYVSRNSDPQLHTHAVVLNITKYQDKLYSVDNPPLYENKILYGQIYRNQLAQELMSRGYAVTATDIEKGFFELEGIPQEALEQFSSRRQEIVQKLKEWGTNTPEAAEKAALLTRKAKEHKDLEPLMSSWRETLVDMGGIEIRKQDTAVVSGAEQKQAEFSQAITRISEKTFAFTEKEMKRAVLAAGVSSGMTEVEYKQLKSKAFADKTLQPLSTAQGETYYSTPMNLDTERQIFKEVGKTKNSMTGMQPSMVEQVMNQMLAADRKSLSDQQRQAVLHITTSRDKYVAVQGLAGTGKTHMLNYTREVLEADGYTVRGACFTGKAAQGLESDAQIPSTTIHAFLNRLEKEAGNISGTELDKKIKSEWDFTGLKPGKTREAWIIDEASLVNNSTLRYVMQAANLKGAKVVLVGDRQQLLPIGVGNAFATLTESGKIATTSLDEIRRQQDSPELLRAVREAVSGDTGKSFAILSESTQVIEKRAQRLKAIVRDYTALTPAEQENTIVLTAANRDRRDINQAVRAELIKKGQLTAGQEVTVTDPQTGKESKREFSPGDKVIFLQNDYKIRVMNGQVGTIAAMDSNTLLVDSGGKRIAINTSNYNAIDHGYAMTTTKSQGITVDRVLINLDSSQKHLNSRNAYYVDISRARYQVKMYTDNAGKIQSQVKNFAKKLTTEDFITTMTKRQSLTPKGQAIIRPQQNIALADFKQTLDKNTRSMSFGR
ncbi:MobF family relaxase [Sporomusa sphaeroides]|uniref:MobF family relaxase n=1 Tax=Sporomusa sphaeroides TaxID=47679 RepID=UPI0031580996